MSTLRKHNLIILWIGYILAVAGPVGYHLAVELLRENPYGLAMLYAATTTISLLCILSDTFSRKLIHVFAGMLLIDHIITFSFFSNQYPAQAISLLGILVILRFRWWALPFTLLYVFSSSWYHYYSHTGQRFSNIHWQMLMAVLILLIVIGFAGYQHSRRLRDKARRTLEKSEAKYRDLYDNAPDMFASVDATTGLILECNQATVEETGYAREEIIGRHISEMYHPDSEEIRVKLFEEFVSTGAIHDMELQLMRKDGSKIDVGLNVSAVRDEEGRITRSRSIWRDITARKQAEKRLIESQEQLRNLASELSLAEEKERRNISAGLHDSVAQVLSIAKMRLGVLLKSELKDGAPTPLSEIHKLVGQALLDVRHMTFDLSSPTLYKEGLEAALEELTKEYEAKSQLVIKYSDDGNPKPLSDETKILLFQASRELLTNVVKHAQASTVKLSTRRDGDEIAVSVVDDGIGCAFTEDELPVYKGSGLGLFSIRERLRYARGKLIIKARPGKETNVTLIAPLKRD